jgi:ornithine cyclodeaminase/alanine dehydrogenase-like protein (mu-crystallin family)
MSMFLKFIPSVGGGRVGARDLAAAARSSQLAVRSSLFAGCGVAGLRGYWVAALLIADNQGMTKIGIIGTGWGARVQVPAFREAGLEVVAIAAHDAEKTRRTAAELGLTPFDDWRALLDSDVDLITIVTPPSEHLVMATAALDAGKHVLC